MKRSQYDAVEWVWSLVLKSQTLIRSGLCSNTIFSKWTWEIAKQRHPAMSRIQTGLGFQHDDLRAWEGTGTGCSNASTELHDRNGFCASANNQPPLLPPRWERKKITLLCRSWISKYSGEWWSGSFFRNCFEKWNLKAKQHKVPLYKQFFPPGVPLYKDKCSLNKEKNIQTEAHRESVSFVRAWIEVGTYLYSHNPITT